ncbi:MAG: aminotransferase class III-fold pyridoxal phosphate-dependent enzyme, partial [Alphaproteobacteria bacterium]|nr:aminotransferase class III-fold pyridoxal phosphate-dependent enzyme [Alphaproteobacteria bacterium]
RIKGLGKYDSVGDARGIGLIGAIEFVKEPNSRIKLDPKHKLAARVMKMVQDAGVIIRALPLDGIAFCPPLIISEDEINMMFDRVESVLPEVDKLVKTLD